MKNHIPTQSTWMALLAVLGGALLAWLVLGRPVSGIDDADIFLVYARNFAEGHGFVYNVGGERVEGFTSMLWTLVCSGMFRLAQSVELPLFLLDLAIGTVAVRVCLRRTERPQVFLPMLLAAPSWFVWSQLALMESGLWCLLLTLAVFAVVERRARGLAVLLPLLALARPEAMLWGGWLLLLLAIAIALKEGLRRAAIIVAAPLASFAVALTALIVFRLHYFGYPVPNTYYAKVSPNLAYDIFQGSLYLLLFMLANPAALLAVAAWFATVIERVRKPTRQLDAAAWVGLCLVPGIIIPVLVGGDHFGGFRFYQPIWPLLCWLVADQWPALSGRFQPMRMRTALRVLVVAGWLLFPLTVWVRHEFQIARDGRQTGTDLAAMFADREELPSVGVIMAGGLKYAYPGRVMDLMGLNSTEMAHSEGPRTGFKNHAAFNQEIFFEWEPDLVVVNKDPRFNAKVLKGLLAEERFRERYQRLVFQRNGREIDAYFSHAFLASLHGSSTDGE